MENKSALRSKEIKENVIKAKFIFFGFVLILAFAFLALNSIKVGAVEYTINGTTYNKSGTEMEDFNSEVVEADDKQITFIQGNGEDNKVAIRFTITNFPKNASSFMVVESQYSDSSDNPDSDRYSTEYTYTQDDEGSYLKIDEHYYLIIEANRYSDASCSTINPEGGYLNYFGTSCAQIVETNRYNRTGNTGWGPSSSNVTMNGITGSVNFTTETDESLTASIVYRIRKGKFGLNFLKVFFFEASEDTATQIVPLEIYYVIAQPIDTVSQGTTCNAKNDTICTDYTNGTQTRESRELKLYIPISVAYNFKVVGATTDGEIVNNYSDVTNASTGSTIYALNYFEEESDGTVAPVATITTSADGKILTATQNLTNANRKYLYTGITKSGKDTNATVNYLMTTLNAQYLNHLTLYNNDGSYKQGYRSNEIDYMTMEVDSTGTYVFYLRDIFGNKKEIVQNVTDVKNRSIETVVTKGNAVKDNGNPISGFGADETFTNESVEVTLKMTVKTNFEFGKCAEENMCATIIKLTKDNVKQIKYWRVDIDSDDTDADFTTENYASESYAANDDVFNLYCLNATVCEEVQNYDVNKKYEDNGAGFATFSDNVLTMYVGLSGRYRFYIEDTYGNNTWGSADDKNIEEFRNPRVEVYAIDKEGPEITFAHNTINQSNGLNQFDIETYIYYRGIELEKNGEGKFVHDGRITESAAVEGVITNYIYYNADRHAKGSNDIDFTNDDAISLSHVIVSEYVYYYSGSKDLYSDFNTYNRVGANGPYYQLKQYDEENYDNTRVNTISKNTKHNSNGLKLNASSEFVFESIKYYHNDGVKSVCAQIGTRDGVNYTSKTELQCVNYYLDHGVDFIIEFTAKDYVGNETTERVYVNVVDTTPAGFTAYSDEEDAVRSSNIGTQCRMEIGQEIGYGIDSQNKTTLLDCYNVILNNAYSFEDNVYNTSRANGEDGLGFYNRINSDSYVKLYMQANDGTNWIDLDDQTFIPNKTGYYTMKIEIHDNTVGATGTNVLTVLVSYYVDRKIVLISPIADEKFYGESDGTFDYCVYIDVGNHYEVRFSDNPYSDQDVYTRLYCTSDDADDIAAAKNELFFENSNSDFVGSLTRLESAWYNANLSTPIYFDSDNRIGVENNYVGLYRIILGTLNINDSDTDEADDDYIVKIYPWTRDDTKYNGTTDANKIIHVDGEGNVDTTKTLDNEPLEDDNSYTQSSINFTIKQRVVNVTANGGEKKYGDKDANATSYNDDDAEDKYLSGYTISGLINSNASQYKDTYQVILGVLRRVNGENVGVYSICNYRGLTLQDKVLESENNMYVGCVDSQTPGVTFNADTANFDGYTYSNGIMVVNADYIKSRALYVKTNKVASGKTLNVTTDARNNNFANYVINYTAGQYVIKPIDLVVQAAPGQRREYNFTDTYNPNPWEIILYGLVDGQIKKNDETFNGYTTSIIAGEDLYYGVATPNQVDSCEGSTTEACYAATLPANASESRVVWKLIHEGESLTGYKTNETYELLRASTNGSSVGSAKLVREAGKNGGWYLYKGLSNDANISGVSASTDTTLSSFAVMTNGMNNCKYDATGHEVSVDGSLPCKNYNLVYNAYYTDEEGYTYVNQKEGKSDADYIYKSNGSKCTVLDPGLPCVNEPEGKIYKILFEIYRREIIMEFNSAIETIKLDNSNTFDIVYGKRYNFYKTKYFDISTSGQQPEDYLFICYKNGSFEDSEFDPDNPTTTGCTGSSRYGLTAGDTWVGIGLTFNMHTAVSSSTGDYYSDDDKAIPAGVYYVYADIAAAQKVNYNFKYQGGAMTIKSKSVDIVITSYSKEYGEVYYNGYGSDENYSSFNSFTNLCLNDGLFIDDNEALVGLGNGVVCFSADEDKSNSNKNIYGFQIVGLDDLDTIEANFKGRPDRNRSVSDSNNDTNGLQDNVGIYVMSQGTIHAKVNNAFNSGNSCANQNIASEGTCVVVAGAANEIENYVVSGESREYVFDMKGKEDVTSTNTIIGNRNVTNGNLYIVPATLNITVTGSQTKMYGCAYNTFATSSNNVTYTYADGYANCVEADGQHYDLGYKYSVEGDKDYLIANLGYNYKTDENYNSYKSYDVSGIKGSDTFRPTTKNAGIKAHALNADGTLYRIKDSEANRAKVKNSSFVAAANNAQAVSNKTYQEQTVGTYIITIGNLNASSNAALATYTNSCNKDNMPDKDGAYACKNYHIDYYGTKVYNTSETDLDAEQQYLNGDGEFPSELMFTITKRKLYVYTQYDEKIYGNDDQDVSYLCGDYNLDGKVDAGDNINSINGDVANGFCTQAQVDVNTDQDADNNYSVNYGLTRYYTKYNSLAKYPWNGVASRNDVQTDVISGKISRRGMGEENPKKDDIKGLYDYRYQDLGGTVALTAGYGALNYEANFYNNAGVAVNINGETSTVVRNGDIELTYPVQFEIILRQIKIAFISYSKVYGEHDDVKEYDILVCAPSETFDFANKKCVDRDPDDEHGLSASHMTKYVIDGAFTEETQETFKKDFIVRFLRVLGENVSCGTSSKISVTLNGSFFGAEGEVNSDGNVYTKELKCNTTAVSGKSVYETLAYVDQSSQDKLGYNYQVSYEIGYVNIIPRPIEIVPDSNQGFMYGDYYGTLIPAITFTDKIVSGANIKQTYGLVNGVSSDDGICLRNIDYYNNGDNATKEAGTCFVINDRKDEYNSKNNKTTSAYNANSVNSNYGLASVDGNDVTYNYSVKNFVFGDVYASESSTRSALSRTYNTTNPTDEKYNRNVGEYTITLGSLVDKTGNYSVSLSTTAVKYEITSATISLTPESTVYSGTTQNNQYKIYGEQDKEITFTVQTTYTVTATHLAMYSEYIVSVCTNATCVTGANLERYNIDGEVEADGDYIYVLAEDVILLNGFAYNENGGEAENLNYGENKVSSKINEEAEVNQASITDSVHFDTACNNLPVDDDGNPLIGCNNDRTLSYGETSRILLGYLHVSSWAQAAGTYSIVNGTKVANNEHGNKNYSVSFTNNVKFTIIPRIVGVQIQNITKTYGQTTDSISCEVVGEDMITPCVSADGILITHATDKNKSSEGYLKYNFLVEHFTGSTRIENILNDYTINGTEYDNSILYSQNSTFVNGLVPASNSAYSANSDVVNGRTGEYKNSKHLGVYVSRDERNTSNASCMYDGDTYGFCEDAGVYSLRFYGYATANDSITKNSYQTTYKPTKATWTVDSSIEKYYYNSYFGYNPNYFVIVVESDTVEDVETDEIAVTNIFVNSVTSSSRTVTDSYKLLKSTGTLTINKKDVKMFVNTQFFVDATSKTYQVSQNTNPPSLPSISTTELLNDQFTDDRKTAVGGTGTYGKVIWGNHPKQVRTGDKLVGELAYCDTIISLNAYTTLLNNGITSDYSCSKLIYESSKNTLNTNLEGYIPIVRDTTKLSIVNKTVADNKANKNYEDNNYSVTFYPGALEITEDDVKPVVEVNKTDVYIEANAIGTYSYECVGSNASTTYEDCNGFTVVGKTELVTEGDPILNWLNDSSNYALIVKGELPIDEHCVEGVNCTASNYYELNYGKGKEGYVNNAIKNGVENSFIEPFTMQKAGYINNSGPSSLKELIITLVDWFGVTAYDEGEVRNGQLLDKHFDRYWYIVIEEMGNNGTFDISRVGKYKVHFYVMDNAGNVSEGNMYGEDHELETTYENVGTLHIIDTTAPVVGTLNLYSAPVSCDSTDCTIEANWTVKEDTYVPINTLYRYDDAGNPSEAGEYVIIDTKANMAKLSTLKKYTQTETNAGASYVEDSSGKYIKIAKGSSALAVKHYSWSNSVTGIWLTITGGSDNSFTKNVFTDRNDTVDNSQWNHYFSRDGGITWVLYDKTLRDSNFAMSGYNALHTEGTREILIKAVDEGIKITSSTESTATYINKYYGSGNANNTTAQMDIYIFEDTSAINDWLKEFDEMSDADKESNKETRLDKVTQGGWNVSEAASRDDNKSNEISLLIYGINGVGDPTDTVSGYEYYRDKRTAYLDRTKPIITFGDGNGEKLYVYEYGCSFCENGYTEYYAGAIDSYPTSVTSQDNNYEYDVNNSVVINHYMFESTDSGYQGNYLNISKESLSVRSSVGGLGNDVYTMKGTNIGQDIRNIYPEDRRYIIYEFDEDNTKATYDLSSKIPTTSNTAAEGYADAENEIYDVIMNEIPDNHDDDYTYTIIYSVIDKAGNESVYIARGAIFARLVPELEVESLSDEVEEISDNTYYLNVEQGRDLDELVRSLSIEAGSRDYYLTQTVYYNGELVVDNKRYDPYVYDGFNTNNPGLYEITYNLEFMYYGKNGESEMMKADPIKLIINVEATAPVVETNMKVNYSNIILLVSLLAGAMFICLVGLIGKKRS